MHPHHLRTCCRTHFNASQTSIAIERHLKLLEESTASMVDAWLSKLDSTQQICSCHSCCQVGQA